MKTKSNAPAYPQEWHQHCDDTTTHEITGGLTKREYFAALAMQGVCAGEIECNSKISGNPEYTAQFAVQCADALIAELNKTSEER